MVIIHVLDVVASMMVQASQLDPSTPLGRAARSVERRSRYHASGVLVCCPPTDLAAKGVPRGDPDPSISPVQGAVLGLFLTSLVLQQTNRDFQNETQNRPERETGRERELGRKYEIESYRLPPASAVEESFRHSGWKVQRARVRAALVAANVPRGRLERFDACGGSCTVEWSPDRKQHRTRADYCGDRFCVPCMRSRGFHVRRKLTALIGDAKPLFMTFTLKATEAVLNDCINHLGESFTRLRDCKLWRRAVTGGAGVTEVKRGSGSGLWHVHLHVVAVGSYMLKADLREAWKVASRGSFIVDIQRVEDGARAVDYAGKYVTKGWSHEVADDHDSLVECVLACRGRRLLCTFGTWFNAGMETPEPGPNDWVRIGRLESVLRAAGRGEPWAVGVVTSLRCERHVIESSIDPPD